MRNSLIAHSNGCLFIAQNLVNDFNNQILKVPTGTHAYANVAADKKLEPRLLPRDRMRARYYHLKEELYEMVEAYDKADLPEVVDGLIDIIYIALGTLAEMHVNASPAFKAVHEANMLKVNGQVAKRPEAGQHDAVKPEGWKAPDIHKAIYGESNGKSNQ